MEIYSQPNNKKLKFLLTYSYTIVYRDLKILNLKAFKSQQVEPLQINPDFNNWLKTPLAL